MVAVSLKKNFFKQKTAYAIGHCDWSSDVCSSDLLLLGNVNDVGHLVVLLGFVGKGIPVLCGRLRSGVPGVIDGMGC